MPVKKTNWMLSSTFPLFAPFFFLHWENFQTFRKVAKIVQWTPNIPFTLQDYSQVQIQTDFLGVHSTEYWLGNISQFILLHENELWSKAEVTVWITTGGNKIKHKNITIFALSTMTSNSWASTTFVNRDRNKPVPHVSKGSAHSLKWARLCFNPVITSNPALCPCWTYFSVYKMGYSVYLRNMWDDVHRTMHSSHSVMSVAFTQFTKHFKQSQQRQPCGINSSDITVSDLQPRELGLRDV